MTPIIPKQFFIHTIEYEEHLGKKDPYGTEQYAPAQTIEHVRVQPSSSFTQDATQTDSRFDSVVFVYALHSRPFVEFKKKSKITFKGREYIIQRVITEYKPDADEVHHYELEVI